MNKIRIARNLTTAAIFVLVLASLAFDTGFGTPSAFGIGSFFLLCPLGGAEAMLASKAFIPIAAVSMLVVLALAVLFGKAWCAWGCPTRTVRTIFKRSGREPDAKRTASLQADDIQSPQSLAKPKSLSPLMSILHDSRFFVLVGALLVSFAVGFPAFCLVCPIGLTFGTLTALWHLFVFKELTLSVLVFPLCLIVELVLYKRWCSTLCPIAALLAIFGRFAKLLRPKVDAKRCIIDSQGVECHNCELVCDERIDLHAQSAQQNLSECTRCGQCASACPANAIKFR